MFSANLWVVLRMPGANAAPCQLHWWTCSPEPDHVSSSSARLTRADIYWTFDTQDPYACRLLIAINVHLVIIFWKQDDLPDYCSKSAYMIRNLLESSAIESSLQCKTPGSYIIFWSPGLKCFTYKIQFYAYLFLCFLSALKFTLAQL